MREILFYFIHFLFIVLIFFSFCLGSIKYKSDINQNDFVWTPLHLQLHAMHCFTWQILLFFWMIQRERFAVSSRSGQVHFKNKVVTP